MLFNISKSRKGVGCEAKRCKVEDGTNVFPGDAWGVEGTVNLCDKHAEVALDFLEAHPDWKPEHRHMRVLEETGVTVVSIDLETGEQTEAPLQSLDPADEDRAAMSIGDPPSQSKAGPIHSLVKLPAPEGEIALTERLASEELEAKELLAEVEKLKIETQDDLEHVAEFLREVKLMSKNLAAERNKFCKPAKDEFERREAWFVPKKRFLDRAEALLKRLLEDADAKAAENNRKALAAAAEASRKGDTEAVHTAISRVQHSSGIQGISKTYYWEHTVIDEKLLPPEWLISVPNHTLLKEHGAHSGETPPAPIPGVVYTRKLRIGAKAAVAKGA